MKIPLRILKDESGHLMEIYIVATVILLIALVVVHSFWGLPKALLVIIVILALLCSLPVLVMEFVELISMGLHLWNLDTGKTILKRERHQNIFSVAFSPDGNMLACGGPHGMTCIEVGTGKKLFRTKGEVTSVAFSHDGDLLALARRASIQVWKVSTWTEILTHKVHEGSISSVTFSKDGDLFACGTDSKTALLWKIDSGTETFKFQEDESVTGAILSPDGRFLASRKIHGTMRIWDIASDKEVKCLGGEWPGMDPIAFSPDGKHLASAGHLWEIRPGRQLMELKGHMPEVTALAFSSDDTRLASGSIDGTIQIWDLASGEPLIRFKGNVIKINAVAFSPNGRLLASGAITKL